LKLSNKSTYGQREVENPPTSYKDWREELQVDEMCYAIFKEYEIFSKLLKQAGSKNDVPATLVEITRCLGNLATNKFLRSEIIKIGGISKLYSKLQIYWSRNHTATTPWRTFP
jgi:hypothetical protein